MALGAGLRLFPEANRISSSFCFSSVSKALLAAPSKSPLIVRNASRNTTDFLPLVQRCRDVSDLNKFLALSTVHGLLQDDRLLHQVLKRFVPLSAPVYALSLFGAVKRPSLSLQNLVIRELSHQGLYEELLTVYKKLQNSGCGADNYTYPFVIKACGFQSAIQTGKVIHCKIVTTGYEGNVVVQTALVDFYARNGYMETSRQIFDGIPKRDLVSWNALLSGYSGNGLHCKAFEVFQRIRSEGLGPNLNTFASIIPVCTRLGIFEIGKSVHGLVVKCGLSLNESIVPALISLYSGFEDLRSAGSLFGLVDEKNVIVWNAIISACTQNNKSDEAIKLFIQMLRAHLRPDLVTFVSVIPSCSDHLGTGESVHGYGIKLGLEHQASFVTVLISMYFRFGNTEAAHFLFCKTPDKTLLTWNAVISGYVHSGFPDMGLDAFRQMQLEGFEPDSVSMIVAVSACTEADDILLGKAAHAYSLRNGFYWNSNVLNALLHLYSNCNCFSYSLKLFTMMPNRNLISWNTMIAGSSRHGDKRRAMAFLQQMQQEHVSVDLVTVISILCTFCTREDQLIGMSIHCKMSKMGFGLDISLANALISMYCNCGDLDSAQLLFNEVSVKSVITWNALMTGYRCHNVLTEMMVFFNQMTSEGHKPDAVTFLNILPVCLCELQGKAIHAYAIRASFLSEQSLLTSLICMYKGFENLNYCLLLYEMSDKENLVVWNTVMSAFVHCKQCKEACLCFLELLRRGIEPDSLTILSFMLACLQLGSLDLANSIMGYAIRKGFKSDVFVNNSLMDLYARCGDIAMAKEIFDRMNEKDIVSWSVIINAYGIHGYGKEALNLLSQMNKRGLKPDDVTFLAGLSACSHAGLVEEGQKLFKSMTEDYKILPRVEHYACMIDLLARAGHLNEAFELLKSLPVKPSASMLESLVGASRMHGNIKLGEEIGRLIADLRLESSGSYVVLSNICAAAERWDDVHWVRSAMGLTGARKVPGFSHVEF